MNVVNLELIETLCTDVATRRVGTISKREEVVLEKISAGVEKNGSIKRKLLGLNTFCKVKLTKPQDFLRERLKADERTAFDSTFEMDL